MANPVQRARRIFHAVKAFHPHSHALRAHIEDLQLLYAPEGLHGLKKSIVRVMDADGQPLATFEVRGDGDEIDIRTFCETGDWPARLCHILRTSPVERLGYSMGFI